MIRKIRAQVHPGSAIVTGSSRGLGREIAKQLASKGYPVVVNFVSNLEAAEATVNEIREAGGEAVHMAGDVSSPITAKNLFDRANDEYGNVRVLVNNAGVGLHKWTHLKDADEDSYHHIFEVNTRGTFNMLREAARRLEDGGRIVSITSTLTHAPLPGLSLYTASKAAIESFTAILAKELAGRDITVNCVAPGATSTEVFLQGKSEETIQHFADLSPLGRVGTPEEVASVVAFLVSPEGGWINGQTVRANGGVA